MADIKVLATPRFSLTLGVHENFYRDLKNML